MASPIQAAGTKVADTAAAICITLASGTWVAALSQWLQITATLVAIVAGVCAARYHWIKTREVKNDRSA